MQSLIKGLYMYIHTYIIFISPRIKDDMEVAENDDY